MYYTCTFQINIGDAKQQVRSRAMELMLRLVHSFGVSTGFEKVLSNVSHRNARVREQILHTIVSLCDIYSADVSSIPSICSRVAILLG